MQGHVIQVGETNFINWQGMVVDRIDLALVFSSEEDAQAVAVIHLDAKVIPHEMVATSNNLHPHGSYHEYHSQGF